MSVQAIQSTQPKKNQIGKLALQGAMGAAMGTGARYVLPTKSELGAVFNKDAVDSFVSSASAQARGADRSILKYTGIGAVAALLLGVASKIFPKHEDKNNEYNKYNALLDAPDYAVEIMWYGE